MNTSQLRLTLLSAAVLTCALVTSAASQNSSVGIYTDESGTTCSFSGNNPGLVTAYVVVRPGPEGFRAVRFSAPVPACFGGVFVEDIVPAGLPFIGESQSGISIGSGNCQMLPVHVLTIHYTRTSSTTPCCPYPVLPESGFNSVQAVNCAGEEISYAGSVAHFNADVTCACLASSPPFPATEPTPWDGQTGVSVADSLSWSGSDYDGDLADFDLYIGTSANPPLFAAHVATMIYLPDPTLEPLAHYYWRVVSRDAHGNETSSPTWEFSTRPVNSPPSVPILENPGDGQITGRGVALGWQKSVDIDSDPVRYDVRLGTENPPPLVSRNQWEWSWKTGTLLATTTYYWQVVARDGAGNESTSETRSFTTNDGEGLAVPHGPRPMDSQWGVSQSTILSWSGNATSYRLFLGTSSTNIPMVAGSLSSPSFDPPGALLPNRMYYWYVEAHGTNGRVEVGPVWRFSTGDAPANTPIGEGSAYVGPSNSAAQLTWTVAQPNGQPLTYDVYFGSTSSPSLAATTTQPSYTTGTLEPGVRYYWRVDTRDGQNRVQGPSWSFQMTPVGLALEPNRPNPFNPQTTIPYSVPWWMHVNITIYDATGRVVRALVNKDQAGGKFNVVWNGDDSSGRPVASGVYFCVLRVGEEHFTRKLVLLK